MTLHRAIPQTNARLKEAIRRKGLSQWRIAAKSGLTPTVLSLIVTGRRRATGEEARRLASALNSDVAALFFLEDLHVEQDHALWQEAELDA